MDNSKQWVTMLAAALIALLAAFVSGSAAAEEHGAAAFQLDHADYAMGVRKFRLEDGDSKVVGWQLGQRWYFGRWKGDDKGVGFVWQGEMTQVAITDAGINWRRRVSLFN